MDPNKDGNTLLHFLAKAGNCKEIKSSPAHQIKKEINFQNKDGKTPLHIAYENNNIEAALLLIQLGANTTIRDKNGKTPYDLSPIQM